MKAGGGSAQLSDRELMILFPHIRWTRAVPVTVPDVGHGLACRFCIARHGLRAEDVPSLPQDRDEWEAHMREHHGDVLASAGKGHL